MFKSEIKSLAFIILLFATSMASAAPTNCTEFGGRRFCAQAGTAPLKVFGMCWKERNEAAQRGDGAKLVPNWLEPATGAAACMATKGVADVPASTGAGKDFCTEQGDTSMQGMLRLCKAGASRDLYVVQEAYCRVIATTFVEVGMLKPGGGFDPINLPLIAPCLRAQGWSISAVEPKGPKPNQRIGATGSL